MNIKAFFLALSRVNAFITFGPRFKGNAKSKKDLELSSVQDRALEVLLKLPELSSFQDKAWVQQRGLRSLKKLPKLSSFQDKALRSLKKLPKLSSFQDKALRSLKKLPKLSSFQDKARIQQRGRSKSTNSGLRSLT